jgi:hypothetical protein
VTPDPLPSITDDEFKNVISVLITAEDPDEDDPPVSVKVV